MNRALAPLPEDGPPPEGRQRQAEAVKNKSNAEAPRRLGLRIAGVEYLEKRIGFMPYAFHKGPVFQWVLARGLKFRPQALDEGQTLAAVI